MGTLLVVMATAVIGSSAMNAPPDDTLRYYLGKSQYALVGEVLSGPSKEVTFEPSKGERILDNARKKGQVVYTCRVRVVAVLQNSYGMDLPKDKEIEVYLVRWPDEKDEVPAALKKGEKCIFFLRCIVFFEYIDSGIDGRITWVATDPWFGVLPYNAKMGELLKAQKECKEPTN